jgi:hypothetical protein
MRRCRSINGFAEVNDLYGRDKCSDALEYERVAGVSWSLHYIPPPPSPHVRLDLRSSFYWPSSTVFQASGET